ncbi:MAG: hypothetical protein JOY65_10640 [Acetobacteraceae bacterium]|nr:hypothetical protein [Acetobacteraceae bacterium]
MSVGTAQPFQPSYTLSIAASTTATSQVLPPAGTSVLVTNAANDFVFVRLGVSNQAATPNDTPVPAGARLLLHAPETVSAISMLLNSGTGTVFVSRGTGTAY